MTTENKTPTELTVLSFPRLLFAWPLVLVMAICGLLNAYGVVPGYVPGIALHASLLLIVIVSHFDYESWLYVVGAVVLPTMVTLLMIAFDVMPPLEWFTAAGQGCGFTAAALTLVILFALVTKTKKLRVQKTDTGLMVTFGGATHPMTKKAKPAHVETDLLESIFMTLRFRAVGELTLTQPLDGVVQPHSVRLDGVIDPQGKAAMIAEMLK